MILAEVTEAATNTIPGQPWMYGVGAVVALVVALYAITRLNPFR